jgi:hypothetical protein
MTILATDNGSPTRLSGSVTVTVIIDKDPGVLNCGLNPYSFSTVETATNGTVVGTVSAGTGVGRFTLEHLIFIRFCFTFLS